MAARKLAVKSMSLLCKGRAGVCRGTGREKSSEEDMRFRSGALRLSSAVAGGLNSYSLENFFFFSFLYKVTAVKLVMALMDGKSRNRRYCFVVYKTEIGCI